MVIAEKHENASEKNSSKEHPTIVFTTLVFRQLKQQYWPLPLVRIFYFFFPVQTHCHMNELAWSVRSYRCKSCKCTAHTLQTSCKELKLHTLQCYYSLSRSIFKKKDSKTWRAQNNNEGFFLTITRNKLWLNSHLSCWPKKRASTCPSLSLSALAGQNGKPLSLAQTKGWGLL